MQTILRSPPRRYQWHRGCLYPSVHCVPVSLLQASRSTPKAPSGQILQLETGAFVAAAVCEGSRRA